jgi:uncharacterized protein DUF3551
LENTYAELNQNGKAKESIMSKRIPVPLAVTLLASLATFATQARAETQYPYCIQYAGGQNGIGAVSCGFVSRAQCMETASGLGSMCVENPAYHLPSERVVKHHRKHKSE